MTCQDHVSELATCKHALDLGMVQVYVVGTSINVIAETSEIAGGSVVNEHSEDGRPAITAMNEDVSYLPIEEDNEDPDYFPVAESDTDDGLSEGYLSDDEEYTFARRNKAQFRNFVHNPINVELINVELNNSNMRLVEAIDGNTNSEYGEGNASSEYGSSDGDVNSDISNENEDGEGRRRKKKSIVYDPRSDHKLLEFKVKMIFENVSQCRVAVRRWAILNGYNLRSVKSNKRQLELKCEGNCRWKLYGSVVPKTNSFTIKTLRSEHTCNRKMENRQASYELRKVCQGFGVTTIEETGNRYERMPDQKRARFLGGPQLRSRTVATPEGTSTLTVLPSYARQTVSSSTRGAISGTSRGGSQGAIRGGSRGAIKGGIRGGSRGGKQGALVEVLWLSLRKKVSVTSIKEENAILDTYFG